MTTAPATCGRLRRLSLKCQPAGKLQIFEAAKKSEDSFQKVVTRKIEDDGFDILMEKVKPLYEELMLMKDEERFRTVGFSAAGPYNRWLLDVQRLRDETDELQFLRNWNIMISDLLQLGMDYLDAKGSETRHTQDTRERFSLAFTSKRGESKRYENDQEALLQYLAEKFHSSPDEIKATIRDTLSTYLDRRDVEIPDHMRNMGALTNEQQEDMTCRMDLQCWGDEHSLEATFACQSHIESLALYTHEWTDGFLESKFSHFRWSDRTKGVVTYMGDKNHVSKRIRRLGAPQILVRLRRTEQASAGCSGPSWAHVSKTYPIGR